VISAEPHDLLSDPQWLVDIPFEAPEDTAFAEALLHVSNGYHGLRLCADFDDVTSDPGLFATDLYDVAIGVRREIVNLPHPLDIRVRHGSEQLRTVRVERRVLDLFAGLGYYERVLATESGDQAQLQVMVGAHATRPRVGFVVGTLALPNTLTSAALEVCWNGTTGNRYLGGVIPSLVQDHIVVESVTRHEGILQLEGSLTGSDRTFTLSSSLRSSRAGRRIQIRELKRWGELILIEDAAGGVIRFELTWAIDTDSDIGTQLNEPANDVHSLMAEHRLEWAERWSKVGIGIEGDPRAQQSIRFCQFNLLQHELPVQPCKITAARGLSSSYHSGATFFDTELHKDAFWAWSYPEVARSHLDFRYGTLQQAKQFAHETGYRGARYPEATNDLGEPNGPDRVLAYPAGTLATEWSGQEVIHISADVAYAVRRYVLLTGDDDFLAGPGSELITECARFAESAFSWCEHRKGYVVRSVMGPDEYHYHVDNNYFTNSMLRWTLRYGLQLFNGKGGLTPSSAADVRRRMAVTDSELSRWRQVADQVYLPPQLSAGVPAQHDGYGDLPDCPPRAVGNGPAARLTPTEAALADSLADFETKLIKQADLVLLLHLFPDSFDAGESRRLFDYYESRTAHESSLSAAPHGVAAARLGSLAHAADFFFRAARYNLDFQPRTNYRNGLHLSAYAGAWQILVEGFLQAGPSEMEPDTLILQPAIPQEWNELTVPLVFYGRRLVVTARHGCTTVDLVSGPAVHLEVHFERIWLEHGKRWHGTHSDPNELTPFCHMHEGEW
jgi:trehalose/maltose hydrolase-like predicted phosphorylase